MKTDSLKNGCKNYILHKSNSKTRIISITVFLITLLLMRSLEPALKMYSGGEGTLDMKLYYSVQYAINLLDGLGTIGRDIYIKNLMVDFVFIVSFAIIQAELIRHFVKKALPDSAWNRLYLLAYARGAFDMLENFFIVSAIASFPGGGSWYLMPASIMTVSKWVFFALSMGSIVIFWLISLLRWKANRKAA